MGMSFSFPLHNLTSTASIKILTQLPPVIKSPTIYAFDNGYIFFLNFTVYTIPLPKNLTAKFNSKSLIIFQLPNFISFIGLLCS